MAFAAYKFYSRIACMKFYCIKTGLSRITNTILSPLQILSTIYRLKVTLATVPSGKAMTEILEGLAVNGKFVIIGAPDEPIQVPTFIMILGRRSLVGWPSGTSIDSQNTLSFSVLSGVRSVNSARFRCVLTTGN